MLTSSHCSPQDPLAHLTNIQQLCEGDDQLIVSSGFLLLSTTPCLSVSALGVATENTTHNNEPLHGVTLHRMTIDEHEVHEINKK